MTDPIRPPLSWSQLTVEQREVMLLASEESPMYELLLPSIDHLPDQPPVKRPGLGPDVARESLAELIDAGLVWMYWLGRSARDLTADEVRNAVEDLHRWKPMDERGCPMIYLTDSGERVFNGP